MQSMKRLMTVLCCVMTVMLVLTSSPVKAEQSSDTDKATAARRVRSNIRVTAQSKTIRYSVDGDDDSIGNKADGVVLRTTGPVKVTYPHLNPLAVQASASTSAVDDPQHAAIVQLVQALAALPGIVKPAAPAGAPVNVSFAGARVGDKDTCNVSTAKDTFVAVRSTLLDDNGYSAKGLKGKFENWRNAIGKALQSNSGPDAVMAGVDQLSNDLEELTARVDCAQKAVDAIPDVKPPEKTPEHMAYDNLTTAVVGQLAGKAADRARTSNKKALDAAHAAAEAADAAASEERQYYDLLLVSGAPQRLNALKKLQATLTDLKDTLTKTYAEPSNWLNGTDYVLALDVTPTAEKMQRVTIKAVNVSVETSDDVLTISTSDAAAASMDVQLDSTFVAEVGIGVTFGFVTRPKYGTGTNADGQTVVAPATPDSVSVDPTVMVNFVPRGVTGAVPIIQVGASTSKTSPAVLLGGGWRMPGGPKGAFVIGVGAMFAWVKDLQQLHVGSVITGTKDIESDLGFDPQPKVRWYFNLQYKF